MAAQQIIRDSIEYGDGAVAHIVVWEVSQPLAGSTHMLKYRLAYVVDGECVLRYDNEAGKGDHRHLGEVEVPYAFIDLDALLADFAADIERWNDEYGPV